MGKFGRMLTILVALLLIMGCAAPQQGTGDTTHSGMDHANMANTLDGDAFDLQFIDGMIVHHEGAIAQVMNDAKVVRDEQNPGTPRAPDLLQLSQDLGLYRDVKRSGGFIRNDESG